MLGILILISQILLFSVAAQEIYDPVEEESNPEISGEVGEAASTTNLYSNLVPELVPVCACETKWDPTATPTHYEADGVTVLTGRVHPADVGICQINTAVHGERLFELGLDAYVEKDNITFANLLFGEQGYAPWQWSEKCWWEYRAF